MQQITATIRGRVQGVGFRYHTRQNAKRNGVVGWVRNNADGSVSCVAQGTPAQIDEFTSFLRQGPPGARVDYIDIRLEAVDNSFEDFQITY